MTIINVIQIGQTSQSLNQGVINMTSFVCEDEQLYGEVEEEAENFFINLLKDSGVGKDRIEDYLIDRFYEDNYQSVSIIFTQPENIQ